MVKIQGWGDEEWEWCEECKGFVKRGSDGKCLICGSIIGTGGLP